ncbi:hypothetical protein GCM10022223_23410 [Kineosporia mesophila]|uniref:Uncharacterized protein n=1 Tax=Kineosporia mesophila TaxID=566012 RepID=A0ABP6ZE53_9ACTN|nr:hypothetical protein [Kineosporia mesophila]MCD5354175.1 hypothetical protein [Kineosporia mesophila]
MFDDLRPDEIPAPPPNALNAAVHRGTSIRRRRTAWVAGVATAVVVGIAVVLSNPFSTTGSAHVVPATAAPTTPPDYSAIPEHPIAEKDGVTFGYLQKITTNADGTLSLLIQPGWFLYGEDAKKANGGEWPLDDHLDGKTKGTEPTEFRLDPKARIEGASALLDQTDGATVTEGQQISIAQMKRNWDAYQEASGPVQIGIWMRLTDDNTITSLFEQFTS